MPSLKNIRRSLRRESIAFGGLKTKEIRQMSKEDPLRLFLLGIFQKQPETEKEKELFEALYQGLNSCFPLTEDQNEP